MAPRTFSAVLAFACAAAALLPAGMARAQLGSDPSLFGGAETLGSRDGLREGAALGQLEGNTLGRQQAYLNAFVRAFSAQLGTILDAGEASARVRGIEDGRRAAEAPALAAGRLAGLREATDALVKRDRAIVRDEPPPPPARWACGQPQVVRIPIEGRVLELDLTRLELDGSPLGMDVPEPKLPGLQAQRDQARSEGISDGAAVDWYLNTYQRGFREGYRARFLRAREDIAGDGLHRAEQEGRERGAAEAERRLACLVHAPAHDEAARLAWAEAWERGRTAAATEVSMLVADASLVVIERVTLRDASGDDVLEPGEEVRLELGLLNAGSKTAGAAGVRWSAGGAVARAEGSFDVPLGAGERLTVESVVGVVAESAPVGSSVTITVTPATGVTERVTSKIVRRAALGRVEGRHEVRDGALVMAVRAQVSSTAPVPPLRVTCRGASAEVPGAGPHEVTILAHADVERLASHDWVDVALQDEKGITWHVLGFRLETSTADAVALAAQLADPAPALAALRARLTAEVDAASAAGTAAWPHLTQYAAALRKVPEAARTAMDSGVSRPLLAHAQGATSRRVHRAVRELLE